jgi:hypothetical protein
MLSEADYRSTLTESSNRKPRFYVFAYFTIQLGN